MEFIAAYAQPIFFAVLLTMFGLFIWGKLRFDIVALGAVITLTLLNIVPPDQIFEGFADPVIILVVSIFIISEGLARSGLIDAVTRPLGGLHKHPFLMLAALMIITAVVSGFISNIAAITVMIPIATHLARKAERPLSLFLMPLAFSAQLGALGTSVGTTPNIIISNFRAEALGDTFAFFDFAPVGYALAGIGLIFILLIGWRLLPKRKGKALANELFDIKDYLTEVEVPANSKFAGQTMRAIYKAAHHQHLTIISILRPLPPTPEQKEVQYETIKAPPLYQEIQEGDILLLRADSETIDALLDTKDIVMRGSKAVSEEDLGGTDMVMREVVIEPNSRLVGKSLKTVGEKYHFGINVLAVSRENEHIYKRLANITFKPGDVLLLQGKVDTVNDMIAELDLLPLQEREIRVGLPRHVVFAASILLAIVLLATLSPLPLHLIFVLAAGVFVLTNIVRTEEVYKNVQWSTVIFLGAMLALGNVFTSIGAAGTLSDLLLRIVGSLLTPDVALGAFLAFAMLLGGFIDNSAVSVMLAPVALFTAQGLSINPDTLLMAVAVGTSMAIFTPFTVTASGLVMSPAGYKVGDYIKLGGILSVIVLVAAFFLIKTFWAF